MITFKYRTDLHREDNATDVVLEVATARDHLDGVVEAFKTFLIHVGHHPDNVERVVVLEPETRQALPHVRQLDLFEDIP